MRSMFLLVLFFILIFYESYTLSEELIKAVYDANKKVLDKEFDDAFQSYTNVKKEFEKIKKLGTLENSIKISVYENIDILDLLIKTRDILPIFKDLSKLSKEEKSIDAIKKYITISKFLKEKNIETLKYIKYVLSGELETFLTDRVSRQMSILDPKEIDKIQSDKNRKKTIGFFEFDRDKRLDFDFQQLLIENFINQFQVTGIMNIVEKPLRGDFEKMINKAKSIGIDLVLTGSYKKGTGDTVEFNLYLLDPYLNKRLADINLIMPITKQFFYTIDEIIEVLKNSFRYYSRFEETKAIILTKKGTGKLTVEEEDDSKEGNLSKYVKDKLNSYISKYVNENKNSEELNSYYGIVDILEEAKAIDFKGFESPLDSDEGRDRIKEIAEKDLGVFDLYYARNKKDYRTYYKGYDKVMNRVVNSKKDYPKIVMILDKVESELKKSKEEVEEEAGFVFVKEKWGLVFGCNDLFGNSLFGLSEGYFYPEIVSHFMIYSGILYERSVSENLLFLSKFFITVHDMVTEKNRFYLGIGLGADLGLRYKIGFFSILNFAQFNYPIININELATKGLIVSYNLGFGFDLSNSITLDIFGSYYLTDVLYTVDSDEESVYDGSYRRRSLGLALNYYFESGESDKTSIINKGKRIDIVLGYSNFNFMGGSTLSKNTVNTGVFGLEYIFEGKVNYGFGFYNYFAVNKIFGNKPELSYIPYIVYTDFILEGKGIEFWNIDGIIGIRIGGSFFTKPDNVKDYLESNMLIADDINRFHFHASPYIGVGFNMLGIYTKVLFGKEVIVPDDIKEGFNIRLSFGIRL